MPKVLPAKKSFKTGNCGRKCCWNSKQKALIDEALPAWHDFSLVKHVDLDGRDRRLVKYKKEEAERIMLVPEFRPHLLQDGVSL